MKRMLIDVSSVCWMSLLAGKDTEHGREVTITVETEGGFREKSVWVNSASYGYENAVNHVVSAMKKFDLVPSNLIFVVEGNNSTAQRKAMLTQYKGTRSTRPPESYEEFNKLKLMLVDAFCNVGAQAVTQDGVEADDVIAYLAKSLKGQRVVLSNDGDLAVLVGDGVHTYRRDEVDINPYGPFPHKYITVYKALVGDSSDNIPGAYKFGEKAFLNLYVKFGDEGLEAMADLLERGQLARLVEDVAECKELQRIMDSSEMVYKSWRAAKLYPTLVNTKLMPLIWRAGMVRGRDLVTDERLRPYSQQVRLITADNYDQAKAWAGGAILASPFVSLDLETSVPEESLEWLAAKKKAADADDDLVMVDVLGSKITGCGLTFGTNSQYTFYFSVDHAQTNNVSVAQLRDFLDTIPRETRMIVHNAAFELPICYTHWGKDWANDPDYHGFLRNVRDTRIAGSYVDENRKQGLKGLSKEVLGYDQETYSDVTTIDGHQYQMNELTAQHVLSYGTDDTICTSALWNHFRIIMELENTFHVFEEVETFPAYLTAKGFVDGVDVSLQDMREMEAEDSAAYDKAWAVLREFLIKQGWEGTVCLVYERITPAAIKELVQTVTGLGLKTQVRTVSKFPALIEALETDSEHVESKLQTIAAIVRENDLSAFNALIAANFDGEPVLDVNSPKKMRTFLYDVLKMPLQMINDITPNERQKSPQLAEAARKFKKLKAGGQVTLDAQELELLKVKAKTDDTAVEFALAFDRESMIPEAVQVLEAFQTMKTVDTRRKMFYRPYQHVRHWSDNKVHSEMKQCQAVTRRYASAGPNLQQLPKRGAGVKFRRIIRPHHKDAVVCSIDFSGQELRLAAWRSQDANMLSCYIGDKLRDIHSITAAGAMKLKWGPTEVARYAEKYGTSEEYDLFLKIRKSEDAGDHKRADDLRKDSKNVNFAAQFGGQAPKLSQTLIMKLEDAQLFLDARSAMFPGVERRAQAAAEEARSKGYAVTMLGARRHLAAAMNSDDRWEVERASRQAFNMEIQGSAAEMTKLAMARLWKSDFLWKYDTRFIAPIHDEALTSIRMDHALEAIKIKHDCMTQKYADMEVPVLGSISLGLNFADQIECGDYYDAAAIQKALDQCKEKLREDKESKSSGQSSR